MQWAKSNSISQFAHSLLNCLSTTRMDTLLRMFFMFGDGRSHCALNHHETESTVGDGFFDPVYVLFLFILDNHLLRVYVPLVCVAKL